MSLNLPPTVAQTKMRHIRVCIHTCIGSMNDVQNQYTTSTCPITQAPINNSQFPSENKHQTLEAYNLPPWCVSGICIYTCTTNSVVVCTLYLFSYRSAVVRIHLAEMNVKILAYVKFFRGFSNLIKT